ncbi:lactate utilization protein C [Acidicapsa dinghuensis]|uniref:Lactate utilization protein C n=1 Tax=Acidicapsa dinghuensis TaxID=2218256 RepID=A0ABW1EGQ3_9BACT|nr:LUD domain-containing protein [Acidicapsa dinghuensis]
MADAVDSRAKILASIRMSLGERRQDTVIAAEYAGIMRDYRRPEERTREALLEHFEDRLREYDAGVYRASTTSIAQVVAEILASRGKAGLAMPAGIPAEWLPDGFVFTDASGLDEHQLDRVEGVLTACTVAIAETGSIALQNAPGQGARQMSLVPDYHLCVVFASQVVASVPDAFDRLMPTASLPTTFISGPSATADIEMTRIKGVHGPRFFDVVIVAD